ncbi:MAG: AI-2E family transporter [Anaerolineae bacterium]|nr:AI-2E family transporter [Anaerolineae bacterium]
MDQSKLVTVARTDDYQPQWSTWTRRVAAVGLLIAVAYVTTLLAPVMGLLSMTFLLSLVMLAPIQLITRSLSVPYGIAVILCYGMMILLVVLSFALFIPASVNGINNLGQEAEQRYSQLQDTLQHYTPDQGVVKVLGIRVDLNPFIDPVRNFVVGTDQEASSDATLISASDLRQVVTTTTETLTSAVSGIAGLVSTSLLALFLSFLVLLDLPKLSRALPGWIPPAYIREYTLLMQQISSVWNRFFRGQTLIACILALLTWLQLTLMGVQNAVVVAIFCGIISLIPTIGGIIALVPLSIIAFLQGSTVFTDLPNGTFALFVVGVNLVISQIVWNVVAPKILGDAVNVPLPIIIIGVFIGAALGGILGAVLIIPMIGTVRAIGIYVLRKIGQQDPFPGQEPRGSLGAELRNYAKRVV